VARFVLAEDRAGDSFRFVLIDGDSVRITGLKAGCAVPPDSVVLRTAEGTLLTRSAALVHIMNRLGDAWRLLSGLLRLVPPFARDCLYDSIAWSHNRLARRSLKTYLLMPEELLAGEE
jgi:predicted DCC family thiol-disulfide oxidoreductase YuxK